MKPRRAAARFASSASITRQLQAASTSRSHTQANGRNGQTANISKNNNNKSQKLATDSNNNNNMNNKTDMADLHYICAACNKLIKRDKYLLNACDKYWHENCLKCDRCRCRLGEVGSTLYTKANMILCRTDYLDLFGRTGICSLCYKIISASELVMRARQNVYHLECFACQICNQRFCIGDRFYLCDNKIVCQYDYEDHQMQMGQQQQFHQHHHQHHHHHEPVQPEDCYELTSEIATVSEQQATSEAHFNTQLTNDDDQNDNGNDCDELQEVCFSELTATADAIVRATADDSHLSNKTEVGGDDDDNGEKSRDAVVTTVNGPDDSRGSGELILLRKSCIVSNANEHSLLVLGSRPSSGGIEAKFTSAADLDVAGS